MDKNKKSSSSGGNQRQREVAALLFIVAFLTALYIRIEDILAYLGIDTLGSLWDRFVAYFLSNIWPWLKLLAFIVSALALWGIYYCSSKLKELRKEEEILYGKDHPYIVDLIEGGETPVKNEKWEKIVAHINSTNPAEWRQAIMEADIMLDELLNVSGYYGDSIGEKLKSVEPSDFLTLDSAWTAHKVRNRVAHDGSNFELNEREAREAIAHFEAVFREFKII